jgi:hypothetical protein
MKKALEKGPGNGGWKGRERREGKRDVKEGRRVKKMRRVMSRKWQSAVRPRKGDCTKKERKGTKEKATTIQPMIVRPGTNGAFVVPLLHRSEACTYPKIHSFLGAIQRYFTHSFLGFIVA